MHHTILNRGTALSAENCKPSSITLYSLTSLGIATLIANPGNGLNFGAKLNKISPGINIASKLRADKAEADEISSEGGTFGLSNGNRRKQTRSHSSEQTSPIKEQGDQTFIQHNSESPAKHNSTPICERTEQSFLKGLISETHPTKNRMPKNFVSTQEKIHGAAEGAVNIDSEHNLHSPHIARVTISGKIPIPEDDSARDESYVNQTNTALNEKVVVQRALHSNSSHEIAAVNKDQSDTIENLKFSPLSTIKDSKSTTNDFDSQRNLKEHSHNIHKPTPTISQSADSTLVSGQNPNNLEITNIISPRTHKVTKGDGNSAGWTPLPAEHSVKSASISGNRNTTEDVLNGEVIMATEIANVQPSLSKNPLSQDIPDFPATQIFSPDQHPPKPREGKRLENLVGQLDKLKDTLMNAIKSIPGGDVKVSQSVKDEKTEGRTDLDKAEESAVETRRSNRWATLKSVVLGVSDKMRPNFSVYEVDGVEEPISPQRAQEWYFDEYMKMCDQLEKNIQDFINDANHLFTTLIEQYTNEVSSLPAPKETGGSGSRIKVEASSNKRAEHLRAFMTLSNILHGKLTEEDMRTMREYRPVPFTGFRLKTIQKTQEGIKLSHIRENVLVLQRELVQLKTESVKRIIQMQQKIHRINTNRNFHLLLTQVFRVLAVGMEIPVTIPAPLPEKQTLLKEIGDMDQFTNDSQWLLDQLEEVQTAMLHIELLISSTIHDWLKVCSEMEEQS